MNLPDLIKTGESNTFEFKEKFDEQTIESAIAFANTTGGTIFIGVSDKNNIKGTKIGKETINQWINQISHSTDPRIIPEKGQIINKEYQEVCATSKRTVSRDLLDLVSSEIFKQIGTTGTGTAYIPKGPNLDNRVVLNYAMFESLVDKVR